MRTCPRCRAEKPLDDFYGKAKKESWCKTCSRARSKAYYHANKEKAKAAHRRWVAEHRERAALIKTSSALQVPIATLKALPKVCAICGATANLCFDHDHASGLLRNRLCQSCNKGLGFFRDNPVLLVKAAAYLKPDIFEATYDPIGRVADPAEGSAQ